MGTKKCDFFVLFSCFHLNNIFFGSQEIQSEFVSLLLNGIENLCDDEIREWVMYLFGWKTIDLSSFQTKMLDEVLNLGEMNSKLLY
jgi:hypothetical protein